jgi:hypothetical protein
MKVPAGTTTISGHVLHSLNASLGLSVHSSADDSGCADLDDSETAVAMPLHGLDAAGGTTTATFG